ncbi:nuclear transport factor 2 family protein [Novosphingobium album (ex Liu et al. 2023)]|uniref:Nuclear transport factor 2 family protein n=1 Tax=Novosphingobium album (ex Liu et al. 2023) TaxID=3031130 RepID=A0ABT5WW25_9SPHN|nr:nuclear transport factor 2 family protein [Novosphingobium album (ex Liu et al. 2023)]MDE8654079.1 nuclear transport factor 2 family protein [Novosphingobium album (ex Liu et al. 2023)]
MDTSARLAAIEAIRQLKARYFRGVDMGDGALVRSILAEDCVLDYMGCCTDPVSGEDFMPAMNVVLKGRDAWKADAFEGPRIVTVHQGNDPDITIESPSAASGIWSFTDRFFLPPGGPYTRLVGWGRYYETYENKGDGWKLKTTRIERIRVEVS